MGIRNFFKNIIYLFKYNIKEINNKSNDALRRDEIVKILNIFPSIRNDDKKIDILDVNDTIDLLINTDKSFVRYGDGEFNIIKGVDIPFQNYDKKLSDRLRKIINNEEGVYVGVPYVYFNIEIDKYNVNIYDFLIDYLFRELSFLRSIISKNKTYLSTEISQLYQIYQEYDFKEYFSKIRMIWDNKELVIVCGETVFKSIDYNIFDNSKSIDYFYAPSKNAFEKYDEILNKLLQYNKDKLFIVILGPTANVLVYDLALNGYRALDMGHIAKDYDYFMKKIDRNNENIQNFFKPD